MKGEQVHLYVDGTVATLALNNPSKRNAANRAMYVSIPQLVGEATRNPAVRVLVLRGEGEVFCSGSDISEFSEHRLGDDHHKYDQAEQQATEALVACPVPVVAAIRGACIGGGLGLALAADLRYAAVDALFAVPPGRLGIGYPLDAVTRLVSTVGQASAAELLLTAGPLNAKEAWRKGLVHEIVGVDELDELVATRCATISSLAPMTLRAVRAALHGQPNAAALTDACFYSTDLIEGINAYTESRRPKFRGQ